MQRTMCGSPSIYLWSLPLLGWVGRVQAHAFLPWSSPHSFPIDAAIATSHLWSLDFHSSVVWSIQFLFLKQVASLSTECHPLLLPSARRCNVCISSNGEAFRGVYIEGDTPFATTLRARRDIETESVEESQKLDQKNMVRNCSAKSMSRVCRSATQTQYIKY